VELRVVRARGSETKSRVQQYEVWFPAPAGNRGDILAQLVRQIDAPAVDERRAAVASLVRDFRTSADAVEQVLALYAPDRLDRLTSNGRVNGLHFLASSQPEAWTPETIAIARETLARVDRSGAGPDTRAALERLRLLLDAASRPPAAR
jgi:hypothetical protein